MIHILLNPLSNNGKGKEAEGELKELFKDKELDFLDVTTVASVAETCKGFAADDTIVVAGGDGTLTHFVNDVYELKLPQKIFLYFCGTGNDFMFDVKDKVTIENKLIPINDFIVSLPKVYVNGMTKYFINGIGFGIEGYCCEEGDKIRATSDKPVNYTAIAIKGLLYKFKPRNATVTVSAVGGVSPYQNTGTYTLSAGDYDYVVTDANGCQSPVHVHLVDPPALSVTATTVDAQCNGGNGSAYLQISGGNTPYTVRWQDNSTGVNNTHLPVNTNFGYTVTDRNGCTEHGTVYASQPESLVLVLSADSVSCHGMSDGGVAITTLSGGTTPYTYSWSNGTHGNSLQGIAFGNYTLTVSDAHGCSISATAVVFQPQTLSARASSTNVLCGVNVGSLTVSASGGTTPYSYVWSNGSNSDLQNGITGGTYSVTVSDANSCSATSSTQVVVTGSLTVSINETSPISCYGMSDASLTVEAQNAQQPAIYMWNNGVSSTSLNGLSAGTYSVTVNDAWGCVGVANHQVLSPSEIVVASQLVEPRCYAL